MSDRTINLTVPFSGFYESWHSENIDRAEESLVQNDSGDPMFWLGEFVNIDWSCVHLAYAEKYVDILANVFEIPLKFEHLSSPREYNFTTDRIFADMPIAHAYLMLRKTRADGSLDTCAKKRFTSCDGFISHYRNDWREWGPPSTWDHNQWGTVFAAWLHNHDEDFRDFELYTVSEHLAYDGTIENWIWEAMSKLDQKYLNFVLDHVREAPYSWQNPPPDGRAESLMRHLREHDDFDRTAKIAEYLKSRARRPYRTTAQMRAANLSFAETPLGAIA